MVTKPLTRLLSFLLCSFDSLRIRVSAGEGFLCFYLPPCLCAFVRGDISLSLHVMYTLCEYRLTAQMGDEALVERGTCLG